MNAKLRILHLEDSETDCELIRHLLGTEGIDCEIVRCETRDGFIQKLEKKEFDLIFADCTLPEFDGLKALELSRERAPEVPFIFVSGTMGEETAIDSLRSGATDYVLKQRLGRLGPAVRRAMSDLAERGRSAAMAQRLGQAQRLEAVGTLAGGIAHDFNNILTIIKSHASLLAIEYHRPKRVKEIGDTIDRAAQRGAELVNQLLAFARKSEGSFIATDINQRIREIGGMLKEAFPRNVTFAFRLDESLPEVFADPGQVERVLINLATNARDAMLKGGEIVFATSRLPGEQIAQLGAEAKKDYLCLRVIDTGTGMDEATRQHIFEPFFTTKPKGKGTGLGMPVVYGLMQAHHGFVDIDSKPGRGTCVSLFFPVAEEVKVEVMEKLPETLGPLEGKETVLIVDDEPDVSFFLEVILQKHGYNVLKANDAEEALELFQKHWQEIQLLFSDIGLPRLSGLDLSDRLKELKPELKTILASGYSEGAVAATKRGIDGFVAKPYEMGELLQAIRSVLDQVKSNG